MTTTTQTTAMSYNGRVWEGVDDGKAHREIVIGGAS
jgi:hypothetical protein